MDIQSSLQNWLQGIAREEAIVPLLTTHCLTDASRCAAFDIKAETAQVAIHDRLLLLQRIYPDYLHLCQRLQVPPLLEPLWNLWLPLAMQLSEQRRSLDRPIVQGILGGQGTGKTTLGAILTLLLGVLDLKAISLSLDDLYKTFVDRQQLQLADPRLIWRGPPGTHEVELGIAVLDQLRHPFPKQPIAIPRFDKSLHRGAGDRSEPEEVQDVDVVLFEGWFVGVQPVDPAQIDTAPPPIVTADDRQFARDCNTRLQSYLPLWERLDRLMVLYLPDYRLSKAWRKLAEHKAIAQGKAGMGDAEIEAFVDYFWKALHPELFITPLVQGDRADLIVEIQPDHSPGRVYGNS